MFGLSKLYAGLIGGGLILVVLTSLYLTGRHQGRVAQDKHWTPIAAELKAEVAQWKAAANAWADAAARQNAGLLAMKADRDAKVAEADRRVKLAQRSAQRAQASVKSADDALATLKGETLEDYQAAVKIVREGLR